jgi:hypothetical protein
MSASENRLAAIQNLPPNPPSQAQWDPSTIANIIFGIVMVFVGMVAIWQGRHRRVVAIDGRPTPCFRHFAVKNLTGVIEEQLVLISQAHTFTTSSTTTQEDDNFGTLRQEPQPMIPHNLSMSQTTRPLPIGNAEANEAITLPHGPTEQDIVFLSNRVTTLSTVESADVDIAQTSHDIESKKETKGVMLHDGVEQINVQKLGQE